MAKRPKKSDYFTIACTYDETFESMKWAHELPYLQFPSHWQIKIIPPFLGATIRFKVKTASILSNENVSIYFDAYNNLGYFGSPYWEIYPNDEGETARFALDEAEEMLKQIELALQKLENRSPPPSL